MDDQKFYLDAMKNISSDNEDQITKTFYEFMNLEHLYDSATQIVKTHLNIFDNEFQMKFQRNPIHSIESRVKSPQSIIQKLQKKNLPVSVKSAMRNLQDIAGIRVICCYINDVYAVAELLMLHDEFRLLKVKDYIKNPKPNGYRSLHIILNVPVYTQNRKQFAPVEIQLRTIAMDFWASLEHQLRYKTKASISSEITDTLTECAETIAETDEKMQRIFNEINKI